MAPHPGIDTDSLKEKARKDLLGLLEGVCKASRFTFLKPSRGSEYIGTGQEEPGHRTIFSRADWPLRQIFHTPRLWD